MWWPFSKKRNSSKIQNPNEKSANGKIAENQQTGEGAVDKNLSVFLQTIAEKRKEDALIGAKVGAKEVFSFLIKVMTDEKGVHIESLLCALGALAGYSCQASIRSEFVEEKGMSEKEVFVIVEVVNGRQYFYGDMINKPLAENQYSVWTLAAGVVQHLGAQELIDLDDVFKYVAETVGSDQFGIPRIPEGHQPGDLPQNYLKHLWPAVLPVAKLFCPAPEWPILFGLAIQEAIYWGKDVLDPLLALTIVMESAVPMAKIYFNDL